MRALSGFEVFEDVGVEDGRGDFVGSAGPFAEVDLAAAVAAEGEVFFGSGDDGFAGGAAEDDGFCFGAHWWCLILCFMISLDSSAAIASRMLLAIIAICSYSEGRKGFMPTRNVHLTEHFDKFVEDGIDSGRFSNASEIVREGLRLLEQREEEDRAKIQWLRKAAKEGFDAIDRGESTRLRSPSEVKAFIRQLASKSSPRNVKTAV
jgi:antitoxin ParD1/3/4